MTHSSITPNRLSYQYTKFIFGVVLEHIRDKELVLQIDEPLFKFKPSGISKESLRNLLKHLDFNYPRDDKGIPVSYTKLTTADMFRHIEWIERQCGFSGFTPKYISQEWERLMEKNR